jgi:hypothetical protein
VSKTSRSRAAFAFCYVAMPRQGVRRCKAGLKIRRHWAAGYGQCAAVPPSSNILSRTVQSCRHLPLARAPPTAPPGDGGDGAPQQLVGNPGHERRTLGWIPQCCRSSIFENHRRRRRPVHRRMRAVPVHTVPTFDSSPQLQTSQSEPRQAQQARQRQRH